MAKLEVLLSCFSGVYAKGIVISTSDSHTIVMPAIGPVQVAEEAILQVHVNLKSSKSPGLDRLRPRLLTYHPDFISEPLTVLFSMSRL